MNLWCKIVISDNRFLSQEITRVILNQNRFDLKKPCEVLWAHSAFLVHKYLWGYLHNNINCTQTFTINCAQLIAVV